MHELEYRKWCVGIYGTRFVELEPHNLSTLMDWSVPHLDYFFLCSFVPKSNQIKQIRVTCAKRSNEKVYAHKVVLLISYAIYFIEQFMCVINSVPVQ